MNYELDQENIEKCAVSAASRMIGNVISSIHDLSEKEAETFVSQNYTSDHPTREELKQTFKVVFYEEIRKII